LLHEFIREIEVRGAHGILIPLLPAIVKDLFFIKAPYFRWLNPLYLTFFIQAIDGDLGYAGFNF
jgi:hypothetical protein